MSLQMTKAMRSRGAAEKVGWQRYAVSSLSPASYRLNGSQGSYFVISHVPGMGMCADRNRHNL